MSSPVDCFRANSHVCATLDAAEAEIVSLESVLALAREFNILDAVGLAHQEIRHSHLLAFLLSPTQTHGLGGLFAGNFLDSVQAKSNLRPGDLEALSGLSVDEVEARREWRKIDVLLLDPERSTAVLIENKIWSKEHGDQLGEYRTLLEAEYGINKVLGLFLSPRGDQPTDNSYYAIDYSLVLDAIERTLVNLPGGVPSGVDLLLRHYADILRRYVLGASDDEQRLREFYARHTDAIERAYGRAEQDRKETQDLLLDLIASRESELLRLKPEGHVQFVPRSWDRAELQVASWSPRRFIVRFQFDVYRQSLELRLMVGPAPSSVELRQRIFDAVQSKSPFLEKPDRTQRFSLIYSNFFLMSQDLSMPLSERRERVRHKWQEFVTNDLPLLEPPIRDLFLVLSS
jgi:hypothetical protein